MKKLCTLLFIAGVTSNLLSAADQGKELARSHSSSSLSNKEHAWDEEGWSSDDDFTGSKSRSTSPVAQGTTSFVGDWLGTCREAASMLGASVIAPFSRNTASAQESETTASQTRTFTTEHRIKINPDGSVTERRSSRRERIEVPATVTEPRPGIIENLTTSIRSSDTLRMAQRRARDYVVLPASSVATNLVATAIDTASGMSDTARRMIAAGLMRLAESIQPGHTVRFSSPSLSDAGGNSSQSGSHSE